MHGIEFPRFRILSGVQQGVSTTSRLSMTTQLPPSRISSIAVAV